MAVNEINTVTSHNLLNYSGMLFCKGNTQTPFSTMIGGKSRLAKGWEFATSIDTEAKGGTEQPAISESASLTAPKADPVRRDQKTNVCQIFQETVSISYGKLSSQEQLSGLNVAGQEPNPANEQDFQVAKAMQKIANNVEHTFLNGVYQLGTHDDVAYKTRGILNAMVSCVMNGGGNGLTYWQVSKLLKMIADTGAPTEGLVLMAPATQILQFNADAAMNGLTIVGNSRNVNGISISSILTPFGTVGISSNARMPEGAAMIFNPLLCAPVELPVPGKGNFFLEPLGKKGASNEHMIYGQLGLDYGAEWCHGKITGLSTEFDAPDYQKKVYVAGGTITTTT